MGKRVRWAGIWVPLAAVAVGAIWFSGLVTPLLVQKASSVSEVGSALSTLDDHGRRFRSGIDASPTIVNEGWLPVTITGVGLRGPGLDLLAIKEGDGRPFPYTVPGRGSVRLDLKLEVTDCAAAVIAEEPAAIVFRVEHWWASVTTDVVPPGNSLGEPWQLRAVHRACYD